jgi:putative transposase
MGRCSDSEDDWSTETGGMPRQARLDAPGALHHVMVRGIEKRRIVDDAKDRRRFVARLRDAAVKRGQVLAWDKVQ